MDLCERYSTKVMNERANGSILIDIAPKDVKQLEILRPFSVPSMGQRYKQSVEKEKRLEAASKPVQSKISSDSTVEKQKLTQSKNNEKKESGMIEKKKKKKKRKKSEVNETMKEDICSLDNADEVEDGINWSDDE